MFHRTGFNLALFEIQFCCYVAGSVLVLFWAVVLAKGVYNLRLRVLVGRESHIATGAKVFAIVAPCVTVGLSLTDAVKNNFIVYLALNNVLSEFITDNISAPQLTLAPVVGSLLLGSVLVLATVVRYVYTRRQLSNIQGSSSLATGSSTGRTKQPVPSRMKVDKALLLRFTIAFLILSAFEVTIFAFELQRKGSTTTLAQQDDPDFGTSSTIGDIILFM